MENIHIVSAVRTPIGAFLRSLSNFTAAELGQVVIKSAIEKANIPIELIDIAIMGQVLQSGHGMNSARQAARNSGLKDSSIAYLVNQACGSGMRAVIDAVQQLKTGQADIILAGGMESMSRAPHSIELRKGSKFGNSKLIDTMLYDGLTDAFYNYHMGITAENIAKRHGISRIAQDEFALSSHLKAINAQAANRFLEEIVPIYIETKNGSVCFEKDECVRHDACIENLSKLAPVFERDGTVTAGNSSPLNDGAAAIILATTSAVKKYGLKSLAIIKSYASVGVDPAFMGEGPVPASNAALERAGWVVDDVDLVESNEAFAAQSLYVIKAMGIDEKKFNVNGGAIALGHPVGASGARVIVTLVHEMAKSNSKRGLATLCIGGGMGISMTLERS